MREIVTLSITTFRGAIGAEHYYGKLHVETKMTRKVDADGNVSHVTKSGYGVARHTNDGHDLTRTIDAKEALYLNKKDGDGVIMRSSRMKPGDSTTRFNDRESIIAAAIETFPSLFDDTDILLYERRAYSDEHEVLVAPDHVRKALTDARPDVKHRWLMENGYSVLDTPEASS